VIEHSISRPYSTEDATKGRKTQQARILRLLLDARGQWVGLPQILDLHISQFGARIFSLRRSGFVIENKTERDESGVIHSYYRLVASPAPAAPAPKPEPAKPLPAATTLFDLSRDAL
jgi:hypothetical protein